MQHELTLNCPEPIAMTDEDKQLINGKEDRGKETKREIICGLTTNYKHNSQTHILFPIIFIRSIHYHFGHMHFDHKHSGHMHSFHMYSDH